MSFSYDQYGNLATGSTLPLGPAIPSQLSQYNTANNRLSAEARFRFHMRQRRPAA